MKEKIKKILLLSLSFSILFIFIILPFDNVEARQGCCSWHGGVCGCRCCDGTTLSAKCAPYYPQCNTKAVPKYDLPASEKYTAEIPKESNGGSIWWWIIGIGVVAYIFYTLRKRRK